MSDEDHLPSLSIPPDHPLAIPMWDAIARQGECIERLNRAHHSREGVAIKAAEQAMSQSNAEIEGIQEEYRKEVCAPPHQRVGLTYDNGWPVVKGRSTEPTRH
ncbi:hypothetical protein [Bradyrhizobium sp. CCBAU 21362]|uniref:hypothetical protein n=1 Tax=Bradyrhizobium sp. CCBAU 21362 TaxID=1325082 RepID=UPI0023054779|nr:hypothetical protein [Bradyrhizobium sp. CCBAU 21362]